MTSPAIVGTDYTIRVVGIYATNWRFPADENAPGSGFSGTRLEEFESAFKDLLPRLPRPIFSQVIPDVGIAFTNPSPDLAVIRADVFLFVLPSDQVVATLTVDCSCPALSEGDWSGAAKHSADRMLDEFTDDAFTINGGSLQDFLMGIVPIGIESYKKKGQKAIRRGALSRLMAFLGFPAAEEPVPLVEFPVRHQIVFVPGDEARNRMDVTEAMMDALVYRRQPRYQRQFMQREAPTDLNSGPNRGVVTTNVSLILGHDPLLQDSVFLSTVQVVGTLSRFRQIWDQAYSEVRKFRQDKQRDGDGIQTRDDLESLVDMLGNLEFDLTFSVEFPLMRIESYHSALNMVLDLDGQADRLSRMFDQLGGSVRSEIAAIDIRANRKSEVRQHRNTLAFNVFALVGVPIGALLAFFGVSANDVAEDKSMFTWSLYRDEYLAAIGLGLLPICTLVLSHLLATGRQRWKKSRHDSEKTRATEKQRKKVPLGRGSHATERALSPSGVQN